MINILKIMRIQEKIIFNYIQNINKNNWFKLIKLLIKKYGVILIKEIVMDIMS